MEIFAMLATGQGLDRVSSPFLDFIVAEEGVLPMVLWSEVIFQVCFELKPAPLTCLSFFRTRPAAHIQLFFTKIHTMSKFWIGFDSTLIQIAAASKNLTLSKIVVLREKYLAAVVFVLWYLYFKDVAVCVLSSERVPLLWKLHNKSTENEETWQRLSKYLKKPQFFERKSYWSQPNDAIYDEVIAW